MLRRTMMAALAVAALGLAASPAAEARGFGHGGWHGHWHRGFWPGAGIGLGLAGAGYYGAYYGYGYPYYAVPDDYGPAYNDGYGGCYVARKRVRTPTGWRTRSVDVCE